MGGQKDQEKITNVKPELVAAHSFEEKKRDPWWSGLLWSLFLIAVLVITTVMMYSRNQEIKISNEQMSGMKIELQYLRDTLVYNQESQVILLKIMILSPNVDLELAQDIADAVQEESAAYRMDPDLVLAIIDHESNFNPKARSTAGAHGIMQVRRHWAEVHGDEDLFDIYTNVRRGLQILKLYQLMYKDLDLALTAYNRGENPVNAELMRGNHAVNRYAKEVRETYERLKSLK